MQSHDLTPTRNSAKNYTSKSHDFLLHKSLPFRAEERSNESVVYEMPLQLPKNLFIGRRCAFDINIGNRFAYRKFRWGGRVTK